MADRKTRHVMASLSGGRNAIDAPTSELFGETQCLDAVNVDFFRTSFARKRNGLSASGVSFSSGGPFTGTLSTLFRHVPASDDTAAEEWAVDDSGGNVVGRKAGGTTFAQVTLIEDAFTGNPWEWSLASLNGKLMIAAKTGQDRHYLWDGTHLRRAGLYVPVAPTAADDSAGGGYPAVPRWYRIRMTEQVAGVTIRRSEPSVSSAQFTPSGSKDGVVVSLPSTPADSEHATHIEIEGSADDISFYLLAVVALGTATFLDIVNAANYAISGLTLSDATGTYTNQKSYRFIAADQSRLLGFGSFNANDKQNRIEFSAVLGSLDVGDVERVDTTNPFFVDLDENDSGAATGLCGPVLGNFYAFKSRQFWELTATGSLDQPYKPTKLSPTIGAVGGRASCVGEDAHGNPTLYFMSHRGMYRYGSGGYLAGGGGQTYVAGGLEYIGKGIEDFILGPTATINLGAVRVPCHMLYHADKRQVWVWWATGASEEPNQLAFYDVVTGGWSRVPTGDVLANARCSMLFSNTIGASMSKDLKPYIGSTLVTNTIYKADDAAATDDAGTAFRAYAITKPVEPGGAGMYGVVGNAELFGPVSAGVTITVTVEADFDPALLATGTVSLSAIGTETRATRPVLETGFGQAGFVQYQIGDASAVSNAWQLDRLTIPVGSQQARTA